jgi:putative transposase
LKLDVSLKIAKITKHQYYYKPLKSKQGIKCSAETLYLGEDGVWASISNSAVILCIQEIQSDEDTNYGYQKMTVNLKLLGYQINHKKVYRIMGEAQLLKEKHEKPSKNYVKYRKVFPKQPLEVLEMDIKFVWIEERKSHAHILTTIDTFTRIVLNRFTAYSIKKEDVKRAWENIIIDHLQPNDSLRKAIHIEVRNDNDSRFSAKLIQDFFKENHLNQVFTHPYTPQENGHIESFHAILSRKLKPYNFWSLEELEEVLVLFYDKYNNQRLHSSVCNLPPNIFLECWTKGLIKQTEDEKRRKITFKLSIPYHQVSENTSWKCSSLQNLEIPPFGADEQDFNLNEMVGADSFLQTSV